MKLTRDNELRHLLDRPDNYLFNHGEGTVDLSGRDLTGADLSDLCIRNTVMTDAKLNNASLRKTTVGSHAHDMIYDTYIGSWFDRVDFTSADLKESSWFGTLLENATFHKTMLSHATFEFASLNSANLTEANLVGTFFDRTSLRHVTISGPVGGSQFHSCDLTGSVIQPVAQFLSNRPELASLPASLRWLATKASQAVITDLSTPANQSMTVLLDGIIRY